MEFSVPDNILIVLQGGKGRFCVTRPLLCCKAVIHGCVQGAASPSPNWEGWQAPCMDRCQYTLDHNLHIEVYLTVRAQVRGPHLMFTITVHLPTVGALQVPSRLLFQTPLPLRQRLFPVVALLTCTLHLLSKRCTLFPHSFFHPFERTLKNFSYLAKSPAFTPSVILVEGMKGSIEPRAGWHRLQSIAE